MEICDQYGVICDFCKLIIDGNFMAQKFLFIMLNSSKYSTAAYALMLQDILNEVFKSNYRLLRNSGKNPFVYLYCSKAL